MSTIRVSRFFRSSRQAKGRRHLLALVLALGSFVILAQGIELGHSHEDLQSQLDCQICVKHSSKGKVLTASDLNLEIPVVTAFSTGPARQQPFLSLPPAKSRAPPSLTDS